MIISQSVPLKSSHTPIFPVNVEAEQEAALKVKSFLLEEVQLPSWLKMTCMNFDHINALTDSIIYSRDPQPLVPWQFWEHPHLLWIF